MATAPAESMRAKFYRGQIASAQAARYAATAHASLAEQLKRWDWQEDANISLTAMWEAVGSPKGLDPRSWGAVANPLFKAFEVYLQRTSAACRRYEGRESFDVFCHTPIDGPGDDPTCAHPLVAALYADYLDGGPAALQAAEVCRDMARRPAHSAGCPSAGFPPEGFGPMPPYGDC